MAVKQECFCLGL